MKKLYKKNIMKIGLCFMNIGEIYKNITFWSRQNKINYCNKYGYKFIEDETVYNVDKPIPWTKIPLLLKYINDYDYLVWVDADILIMNMNTKIEQFINMYPFDIICGSDWKMINTGVMIIKCSNFSKEFIKTIETNEYDENEDKNGRYMNWEQGSFINLYDKNFMNCQDHIKVTIPTEMNSYWFNYFPGHFVLHFAGVRGELLQYLIRDYYPERLSFDDDNTYNTRMEWLSGPVRDHLEQKLNHEKKLEIKHIYSHRILLENIKPYHYDIWKKIRLGNKYDGGYVIPNLPYTKLYSYGLHNSVSFENDFINKYQGATAYLYDIKEIVTNLNFLHLPEYKSLDHNEIEDTMLLKINMAGKEYDALLATKDETLIKFMSIVIQYHWLSNDDFIHKINAMNKLNKYFYPIHIHGNNHSPVVLKDEFYYVPDVIEVTYIRKDLMEDNLLDTLLFPTKLDYPNHGMLSDIKFNFYPFQSYYFSLTTIPSRIDKLEIVINSLQKQLIKPKKIYIHIPKYYSRFKISINNIDEIINNYKEKYNDLVVINICDKDYGPATKFLPMMNIKEIDDDTPIIIVDDDVIYDPNLSANLLKDSVRYPNSCITAFGITHSAYMFDNNKWFCNFNSQYLHPCGFRNHWEGYIDVFEAFHGCLLKKKLFKEDVFNFPSAEFCFSDDVWFSGHILKNGFNIFLSHFKIKSKFHYNDVDALSSNLDIRNKRMYDVASYFYNNYGIWKKDP